MIISSKNIGIDKLVYFCNVPSNKAHAFYDGYSTHISVRYTVFSWEITVSEAPLS